MIAEAIDRILKLAAPTIIDVGGRKYSDRALNPVMKPTPKTIVTHTLTGLVDYIDSEFDGFSKSCLMVLVNDYNRVSLVDELDVDEYFQRNTFLECTIDRDRSSIGQFIDLESFNLMLQSQFVQTTGRDAVLALVGNITDSAVRQTSDDGVTQTVVARKGITRSVEVEVPNPVILAPYRTFSEIEQPESPFVLRIRSGKEGAPPTAALFEGDGGRWKHTCILAIRSWLKEQLPDIAVIA